MAPRLAYSELHIIIFWVSWIILIINCQALPNPLSTNHSTSLYKNVLELVLQTCVFFEKIHGMCKHRQIVIFHIFLGNVYDLFKQCKILFIYFCINPSPCCPFICFIITLFHFVPNVLILNRCRRGSNLVSSFRYSKGFFVIS